MELANAMLAVMRQVGASIDKLATVVAQVYDVVQMNAPMTLNAPSMAQVMTFKAVAGQAGIMLTRTNDRRGFFIWNDNQGAAGDVLTIIFSTGRDPSATYQSVSIPPQTFWPPRELRYQGEIRYFWATGVSGMAFCTEWK